MKGVRSGILSLAAMLVTGVAAAQNQGAPIDLAVTYEALHSGQTGAQSFWLQGGAVELGARAYRGLGIVARVEGLHVGANSTASESLSLLTTVFGPRYTVHLRSRRYALFGEGLVGVANGFDSLFSEGSGPVGSINAGTTSSSNALAVDVGGGLDLRLNHRFAIRVLRASYLRTQFPNATTNVQNSLSLGAGLVMRFGK
jgi:hypothetical protein